MSQAYLSISCFLEPLFDIVKGSLVRHVVHHNDAMGSPVVVLLLFRFSPPFKNPLPLLLSVANVKKVIIDHLKGYFRSVEGHHVATVQNGSKREMICCFDVSCNVSTGNNSVVGSVGPPRVVHAVDPRQGTIPIANDIIGSLVNEGSDVGSHDGFNLSDKISHPVIQEL